MNECMFCKNPIVRAGGSLQGYCPHCYSRFLFSGTKENSLLGYMLVAEYNGQFYGAVFYICAPAFILEKIDVDKATGKSFYSMGKPVLELRYIPNITPENFAKKIPTLLTFS